MSAISLAAVAPSPATRVAFLIALDARSGVTVSDRDAALGPTDTDSEAVPGIAAGAVLPMAAACRTSEDRQRRGVRHLALLLGLIEDHETTNDDLQSVGHAYVPS